MGAALGEPLTVGGAPRTDYPRRCSL